ncbi:RHS repeat domain-containing protein [Pirellulaceae bacterium SH449]
MDEATSPFALETACSYTNRTPAVFVPSGRASLDFIDSLTTTYTAHGQRTILNASGTVLTSSEVGNRYIYTGREWDGTVGLHHFRARWMSPLAGRFLGRDPISAMQSINKYRYVRAKPFSMLDPSGMIEIDCSCSCGIEGHGGRITESHEESGTIDCQVSGQRCCQDWCEALGRDELGTLVGGKCTLTRIGTFVKVTSAGPDGEGPEIPCSKSACEQVCSDAEFIQAGACAGGCIFTTVG